MNEKINKKSDSKEKNIIIGAGPGGRFAGLELGMLNKDVTLIEKKYIGGNCLNEGCMVLCALSEISSFLNNKKKYEDLGLIKGTDIEIFYEEIIKKINETQQIIRKIHTRENQDHGNRLINGVAKVFEDNVVVNGETLEYNNLLIATGSRPFIPNVKGSKYALSSPDILKIDKIPEKLHIIGGGAIATEISSLFSSLGSEVKMIVRGKFLKEIDKDLRKYIIKNLLKNVEIYENQDIKEIKKNKIISKTMEFEGTPFLATGRIPNSEIVKDLVELDEKNAIKVDKMMKTSKNNIYAAGDVTGGVTLTPIARMEGIVAGRNMGGYSNFVDYKNIPQGFNLNSNINFIQDKNESNLSEEKEIIIPTSAGPGNFWKVLTRDTGISKIRFNTKTKEIKWAGAISPSSVSDIAYISYLMRTNHDMSNFTEEYIEIHPSTDVFHKLISEMYKY
jgi:dihydrolipoamide dehydrogenase